MIDIDAESQAKTKLLNQLNDPTKSTIADTISLIDQLKALNDEKHLIERVKKAYGDKYKEPTKLPTVEAEIEKPTVEAEIEKPTIEAEIPNHDYNSLLDKKTKETIDDEAKK